MASRRPFEELPYDEIAAFKILKAKLVELPVPVLPRSQGNYTVETDACDK